ncbi:hypothetical protein [Sphingomonas sp. CROZ-RG-20F-R02-07]|uniref:hypothetical protein n=1 Tax=Sphingomonas sp. CROZ-RG-20F-R02-07 TaxID=2914832 RepID=UPI001F5AF6B4|nr:hypothetical protein [Sphingomonas sp. CROZ-RG-20F-R02-07]
MPGLNDTDALCYQAVIAEDLAQTLPCALDRMHYAMVAQEYRASAASIVEQYRQLGERVANHARCLAHVD